MSSRPSGRPPDARGSAYGGRAVSVTGESRTARVVTSRTGSRGGALVLAGQAGRIAIQLIGVTVLSRVLSPADFGLVAMIAVFMALADLLRDFGIPTAALQAPRLTHQQASNAFWITTGLGVLAATCLLAGAPLISRLYNEPRLSAVVVAMAGILVVNGAQAQVQVHLARSGRYGTIALTDVTSQALALVVAVLLAVVGWGYWALVVQVWVGALTAVILRGVAARWVPLRPRRRHGVRNLLKDGADLGLAQLLAFIANNADTVSLGVWTGASAVGFYNRGFQIYTLPRGILLDPLTQVVVPTIARDADGRGPGGERAMLRTQGLLAPVTVLAYTVIGSTAAALVPLVLGQQWEASVPVVRWLAIGGAFAAFGSVGYWLFLVRQLNRHLLYLHLVTKSIFLVLVLLAAPHGASAVAVAYSASQVVAWPINMLWLRRVAGLDARRFVADGSRPLAAGTAAWLATWAAQPLLDTASAPVASLAGAAVATAVFVGVFWLLPGGRCVVLDARERVAALTRRVGAPAPTSPPDAY